MFLFRNCSKTNKIKTLLLTVNKLEKMQKLNFLLNRIQIENKLLVINEDLIMFFIIK